MITQRKMKHTHQVGVLLLVPHSSFTPTPTMTPLEIAFHKGRDAKRRGRPAENPHTDFLAPNNGALAAEWDRGYGE
jgi:hypothetical protein